MMKVVQCWDDGVINDLRLTGMLRQYGAKAMAEQGKSWREILEWYFPGCEVVE